MTPTEHERAAAQTSLASQWTHYEWFSKAHLVPQRDHLTYGHAVSLREVQAAEDLSKAHEAYHRGTTGTTDQEIQSQAARDTDLHRAVEEFTAGRPRAAIALALIDIAQTLRRLESGSASQERISRTYEDYRG